jgi:gluconolactonase
VFLAADAFPEIHERTNGLTVGADGCVYACEYGPGKGGILRITPDGQAEVYAGEYEGKVFNRPNDLIFGPNGNLYFTDPKSYDPQKPDGRVFRVDRETREIRLVADGVCFSNGLVFSADGRTLFVAESAHHRVLAFPVDADGNLGERRVFAEMPGGDPDGMNFDRDGNLYVAHFGGGAVWVFRPDGSLLEKIPAPGKKPSNVEFGGPDLTTLFVTEDETNAVYKITRDTPGLPLFFHPETR